MIENQIRRNTANISQPKNTVNLSAAKKPHNTYNIWSSLNKLENDESRYYNDNSPVQIKDSKDSNDKKFLTEAS